MQTETLHTSKEAVYSLVPSLVWPGNDAIEALHKNTKTVCSLGGKLDY